MSFFIQFKNEILSEILQAVGCHIYDSLDTIYLFIKPFLNHEMSIFEEYGANNIFTKVMQKVLSLIDFLSFTPGIF